MATKFVTVFSSDLSGKELQPRHTRHLNFSVNGKSFELDLSEAEFNHFMRNTERFRKAGRQAPNAYEGAKIRAWAKENGFHDISDRGRLSQNVIDAYYEEQNERAGVEL